MKLKKSTLFLMIGCIAGLSLLLYPTVSNYWNEKHATHAIATYVDEMAHMGKDKYKDIWLSAIDYNDELSKRENEFTLPGRLNYRYPEELNVSGSGIMGYIEIDKLDVSLPIYHGTADTVLQSAIGHLDWSYLPTGGPSTHCVLSGHRGLTRARLFTDLDEMREGDTFELVILGETLTYEVDQIRTVLPSELNELRVTEGMDYCTLVTCTPYGVNSHRLLVRGHRIENKIEEARVVSEAVVVDPLIVAPVVAMPLLLILLLMVLMKKPEQPKKLPDIPDTPSQP